MKKIKIGLLGANGKMGIAIQSVFKDFKNLIPFVAISSKPTLIFKHQFSNLSDVDQKMLSQVDVWIDFSNPELLINFLNFNKKKSLRLISGTTGLSKKDFSKLKLFSKKSAVFWSSNMSPGLWAFRQSLKSLSLISNFNVEIEETHHIHKRDNPSGTALTLQKDIESILKRKIKTPVGHRKEEVFGIHQITAESTSEIIKFEHIALNRTVFAQGALKAASFLVKKKRGFYSMEDLYKK